MLPSLLLFDGPVDKLTRISKEFLTSPTIDGAQTLHDELKRYLSLPDSLGQVGLFLLRGGLNDAASKRDAEQRLHEVAPEHRDAELHFRALHLHPYYAERFNLRPGMFPIAEMVSERTLSLPLSAGMTDEQVERVTTTVRRMLLRAR